MNAKDTSIKARDNLRIQRADDRIQPIGPPRLLGHQHRIERGRTIPRHLQPHRPHLGIEHLRWWIAMPTLLAITLAATLLASGYANPTRRVLVNALHTRTELRPRERRFGSTQLGYCSDVIEVVEDYPYRPLLRPVFAAFRALKRLQSGRLDAYIVYMLITLIGVIAVAAALA